jgi:hypothetical protein
MRPLKEWFDRKIEILKNKNLHFKDEYVIPVYSFYVLMKKEYSDYHIDDWEEKFKDFYKKNFGK